MKKENLFEHYNRGSKLGDSIARKAEGTKEGEKAEVTFQKVFGKLIKDDKKLALELDNAIGCMKCLYQEFSFGAGFERGRRVKGTA